MRLYGWEEFLPYLRLLCYYAIINLIKVIGEKIKVIGENNYTNKFEGFDETIYYLFFCLVLLEVIRSY